MKKAKKDQPAELPPHAPYTSIFKSTQFRAPYPVYVQGEFAEMDDAGMPCDKLSEHPSETDISSHLLHVQRGGRQLHRTGYFSINARPIHCLHSYNKLAKNGVYHGAMQYLLRPMRLLRRVCEERPAAKVPENYQENAVYGAVWWCHPTSMLVYTSTRNGDSIRIASVVPSLNPRSFRRATLMTLRSLHPEARALAALLGEKRIADVVREQFIHSYRDVPAHSDVAHKWAEIDADAAVERAGVRNAHLLASFLHLKLGAAGRAVNMDVSDPMRIISAMLGAPPPVTYVSKAQLMAEIENGTHAVKANARYWVDDGKIAFSGLHNARKRCTDATAAFANRLRCEHRLPLAPVVVGQQVFDVDAGTVEIKITSGLLDCPTTFDPTTEVWRGPDGSVRSQVRGFVGVVYA